MYSTLYIYLSYLMYKPFNIDTPIECFKCTILIKRKKIKKWPKHQILSNSLIHIISIHLLNIYKCSVFIRCTILYFKNERSV